MCARGEMHPCACRPASRDMSVHLRACRPDPREMRDAPARKSSRFTHPLRCMCARVVPIFGHRQCAERSFLRNASLTDVAGGVPKLVEGPSDGIGRFLSMDVSASTFGGGIGNDGSGNPALGDRDDFTAGVDDRGKDLATCSSWIWARATTRPFKYSKSPSSGTADRMSPPTPRATFVIPMTAQHELSSAHSCFPVVPDPCAESLRQKFNQLVLGLRR